MAFTAHEIPRMRVTVLQVVLTTMLTAAVNYAALWPEFAKGEAIQGPRLTIEGRRFACIDIVNYGVRPLGTVRLAIPAGTNVSAIQSSEPIQMWQEPQLNAYSGHRERSVRFIVNGSGRSEATLVVVC